MSRRMDKEVTQTLTPTWVSEALHGDAPLSMRRHDPLAGVLSRAR